MKISYAMGAVVAAVVVVGGIVWYKNNSRGSGYSPEYRQAPAEQQPATTQPAASSQTPSGQTGAQTNAAPAPQSFTVNGNDAGADLTTITVPVGTPVTITFGADAEGTYHGGLDFRSSVINTGPISPGGTKTVRFTAAASFAFTPYWPSTNIVKPYRINVVVQ